MASKDLLFFDTETTSLDEGRVIELAYTTRLDPQESEIATYRCRPPVAIEVEAMAVHHIQESDVINLPYFLEHPETEIFKQAIVNKIFVAHNAPFDIAVLEREGIEIESYIDTKRLAQHLFPDAKSHSLQNLRYYLGAGNMEKCNPHAAACDVLVLTRLWTKLANSLSQQFELDTDEAVIEKALHLTKTPILQIICKFPKYKGKSWSEINRIDKPYLHFLLSQGYDDEDLNYTLKYWIGTMPA